MPDGGPGMLPIGELIEGKYQILREIGRGTLGAVYEAVEQGAGRRVAVKVLRQEANEDAELCARFERDTRTAGTLGHPNIVQVLHLGRTPAGLRFLVMELLAGPSLASTLRRSPRLAIPLATQIMAQTLAALAAAHKRGILHRTLRPDNIFVAGGDDRPPEVKLVDFGMAKVLKLERKGPASARLVEPKTGPIPAGVPYLAPEQTLGKTATVDERTDVYAAGVVLYEMLCAQLPYRGNDVPQIIGAILDGHCPPPRDLRAEIPQALEATILRALARTPKDRFPTAEAMRAALMGGAFVPTSAVPTAPATAEDSQAFAVPSLQLSNEPPHPAPADAQAPAGAQAPPPAKAEADGLDKSPTTPVRVRERPLATPAAPSSHHWIWPAVVVVIAAAAGLAFWRLRPRQPPPAVVPAAVAPPEIPQMYHLVVDPPDASVEIDRVAVTVRDLPIDPGPPRMHHVMVAAPGRVPRSFSFTPKPGMSLLLRLGRTLPPPLPWDPPPLPSELDIPYPKQPPHGDEIARVFAKLERIAGCLAGLGFSGTDSPKPVMLGRPRPDQVARCQKVMKEAALTRPKLDYLEAAGAAFMTAAFAEEQPETLAQLTLKLRAEFLAARTLWQTNELARLGDDEGRKAGWHLRKVALAAQAWVRARKAGAKAALWRAEFAASLDELGRYPKDEMVHVAGASVFVRQAQDLLALSRPNQRTSDAAVFDACRKLFAYFDALVLE